MEKYTASHPVIQNIADILIACSKKKHTKISLIIAF